MILVYCLYSFLNDSLIIYRDFFGISNSGVFYLLSFFTILEYILFSTVIYSYLKKNIFKKIILAISPLFLAFSVILLIQANTSNIDSTTITVENIIIIIFCLFFFFEEISEPRVTFIYSINKFWVIAGILIYSTGTFFLFMFSENLSDDEWDKWSIINYVFTILKNSSFSIAVIMKESSLNLPSIENENEPLQQTPLTPLNSNP